MVRGIIDTKAMMTPDMQALKNAKPPASMPFDITKLGHAVLKVSDLARSVDFYTNVMGFQVSDVYPHSMMPGKMVFMRFNNDHHGIAIVGDAKELSPNRELHHMAFEVATLDEVLRARTHLELHGIKIDFEGRRRAGCQVALEFCDPDNHFLEIYWGLDQVGLDDTARLPGQWREAFSLEEAIDNAPVGQDTTLADPSLRDDVK